MSRQIPEINYLMSLVEKRFCKSVKTSTDFYSLAQEIESETLERIFRLHTEKDVGLCQHDPASLADNT